MSRAPTGLSPREKPATPDAQSHAHVRGSVALVAGKGLDLVSKFALQILLVHQLAQGDYGTFVYGNTLAGLFAVVIKVGQGRAIGRLVPQHQEREDPSAIADVVRAATIIVVGSTTVFLFAIALIFGVGGLEPTSSTNSGLIVLLLLLQAPLTAVGSVAGNLLAAYGDVRSLFLREHIVEPAVKLGAVLAAVASSWSVVSIAAAWLGATAAGVLYASLATLRHLHGAGSSGHIPVRSQLG
jgi:O-antigen/teichoic acid export membrane protein